MIRRLSRLIWLSACRQSARQNATTCLLTPARARPSFSTTSPDRPGGSAALKARCCRGISCKLPPAARWRSERARVERAQGSRRERRASIVLASAPGRCRPHRSQNRAKKGGLVKQRMIHAAVAPSPAMSTPDNRRENCQDENRRGSACLAGGTSPLRRSGLVGRARSLRAFRDPPPRFRGAHQIDNVGDRVAESRRTPVRQAESDTYSVWSPHCR